MKCGIVSIQVLIVETSDAKRGGFFFKIKKINLHVAIHKTSTSALLVFWILHEFYDVIWYWCLILLIETLWTLHLTIKLFFNWFETQFYFNKRGRGRKSFNSHMTLGLGTIMANNFIRLMKKLYPFVIPLSE